MTAIRGSKRPVPTDAALAPAQKVNAQLNCDIHNRFDIEVVDARTGEIKQKAQAENVICNALWTRLFTPTTYNTYIHYGTGSGTPAATDTSLFTFLGYGMPATANDVYSYEWADGYISLRRKIQLLESTAVGSTLSEVGIGYSTTAATLVTHAMLKDMNGNTITIAKTDTDIINIYSTVFLHWATAGYDNGSITIIPCEISSDLRSFWAYLLGVYYDVNYTTLKNVTFAAGGIWPCGSASYYQSNKAIEVAGTQSINSIAKTITFTASRLAAASGNYSGFATALVCAYGGNYPQFALKVGGSWYSGTSITGEAIATGNGSTKDFATDFPFISSPTIYVDGVAQSSGVTVDLNKPLDITTMGKYFEQIDGSYYYGCFEYVGNIADHYIGKEAIYYNPYYSLGITSFIKGNYYEVYVSDDLATWTQLGTSSAATVSVDAAYRYKKYWKILSTNGTVAGPTSAATPKTFTTAGATATNIHFTTAPASGAVITADYTTKTIAKDANHVFDLTVTIQLGEYTE